LSDEPKKAPDATAFVGAICPIPISDYPTVQLAHGGGGRLSQMLIENMFLEAFRNPVLETLHDGAVLDAGGARLAFSTDSFVIRPLFFPGGDIGSLAVHGTINDVAMCGAKPLAISAGLILEEGFPMEDLWRITTSLSRAAGEAGVPVVTGDTKVVDRGKGDGVYINTTGIGVVYDGIDISPQRVQTGDKILLSGALAEHGIAIMSVREGLEFETSLETDSAALHGMVEAIVEAVGADLHILRDPTRGGIASALNEIAQGAGVKVQLDERSIPLREEVRGACEILGFDPLYVANEGKCIAFVAPDAADAALEAMRSHPRGSEAAIVGKVVEGPKGQVVLRSRIGGERIVDMMSGEQLPRIC
jgi:hydrogenase expression/formation protein HypE